MKKLTLKLDELRVDSFDTSSTQPDRHGTVIGRESEEASTDYYDPCQSGGAYSACHCHTVGWSCVSCGWSCVTNGASCVTCGGTCPDTCDYTCGCTGQATCWGDTCYETCPG